MLMKRSSLVKTMASGTTEIAPNGALANMYVTRSCNQISGRSLTLNEVMRLNQKSRPSFPVRGSEVQSEVKGSSRRSSVMSVGVRS